MEEDNSSEIEGRFTGDRLTTYIARVVRHGNRRRVLYILISLVAISVVLDILGWAIWSRLGGLAFAGIGIYIGILMLFGIPSRWGRDTAFRVVGLIWTTIASVVLVTWLYYWLAGY